MNRTVSSSFLPESPEPRRSSRRLLLVAAAVVLLFAVAGGLFFWQREQAARADMAARLAAVRQAAITTIQDEWDVYGACPTNSGTEIPCQSWFVDASVTKNGTITLIGIGGSIKEEVPNDGVVTKEELTGTLNVSHMVILKEELPEKS